MPYKVFYIDDESIERSQSFAEGLSNLGLIEITISTPTKYEVLINELVRDQDNFDALILDLKLDGNQQGERIASYTAPSLASGIRSKRFNDDGFNKEFPIFLISSSEKLKKHYDPNTTSHDLFDYTFNKTCIGDEGEQYEKLIDSFTNTYKTIQEGKNDFEKILGITKESLKDTSFLSSRLLSGEETTVTEISQFIFNDVIMKSGILIDQETLAARLGIDLNKSTDWKKLLDSFVDTSYTGVFSKSLKRWWANDILHWWNENISDIPLIRLDATERINLMKEKLQLPNLVDAKPIAKSTSTKYWTICQAFKLPIDPKDGFLVDGNQSYPWQDKKYLSLESILEREAKKLGLSIHPLEKERFEDIKEEYI